MIEASQFNKLSREHKIMEVANHVIELLDAGKVIATESLFILFKKQELDSHIKGIEYGGTAQLWPILPKLETCECCAVGACVMALGRFTGDFNPKFERFDAELKDDILPENSWVIGKLTDLFGLEMTQRIEIAYEQGSGYWRNDFAGHLPEIDRADFEICKDFGLHFDNERERMKAIMQNILDNKGEFKPPVPVGAE